MYHKLSLELPMQFSIQCWNIVISVNFILGTKFSVELQVLFRFFWACVWYPCTTRLGRLVKGEAG